MVRAGVRIEGMREVRSALRKVDKDLPKTVRIINRHVGETVVLPDARRRARQPRTNLKGNPTNVGSAGVDSIRVLAQQRGAQIAAGGARVPYFGGHDWGSKGTYPQFPPKRKEGYILYPSVEENRAGIVHEYERQLGPFLDKAFSGRV